MAVKSARSSTKRGRGGPEEQQQTLFFEYCRARATTSNHPAYHLPFHIGNERKASIQRRVAMKRAGVRKGVPDICVPVANDKFNALFIEMKVHPNKVSPEQAEYLRALNACGNYAVVAWTGNEAIDILEAYIANKL